MENYNFILLKKMGINSELKQKMLEAEGLKGVAVYFTLDHVLRHIKGFRIRMSILPSIAQNLHTSVRYIMKIIRNYGLFVIDGEEFYSPEITDLMLRVKIKSYERKEKELQHGDPKKKSLSEQRELSSLKKSLSDSRKQLNATKIEASNMYAKITTISQFKLREREKEKRENASGGRQEETVAARNFSQQSIEENATNDLNQDKHSNEPNELIQANQSNETSQLIEKNNSNGASQLIQAAKTIKTYGPLTMGNALPCCGEVKLWSYWADEMEKEKAFMERMAKHSRLGIHFMKARKRIVALFKDHVETYSTSDGLITQNDVKYYFSNFMKPESPTWKWVIEKLQEEEEARKAADPYRYEKRVNGVRMYPGGGVIPDEATPRPSMYAVWSEVSQSWVGK